MQRLEPLIGNIWIRVYQKCIVIESIDSIGWVNRVGGAPACDNDRRGIYAHITDDGRARYDAARPTHRAVLASELPANAPTAAA